MSKVMNWQINREMEYPYEGARPDKQIAYIFDTNKCIDCQTCTVACKTTWTSGKGQEQVFYNNVETKPYGFYPHEWDPKLMEILGPQEWKGKTFTGKTIFEATQDGIAEATGISTTHVPRSVQGLRKKGLVDEHKVAVTNSDRRRKVYRPTDEGYRRAQELKGRLMNAEIIVREPGGQIRASTLRELYGPTVTVGQLLRLMQNAEPVPVVDLVAEGTRAPQPSPAAASLYNRIPQVTEFVGRRAELKGIQNALKDPRVRLIVVTGIAGIGKTTFVAKALQRTRREQIFWYRLHEWETLRNMGFVMGEFLAQLGKPEFKGYMEGRTEHDVAEAYEIVQGALEGLEAVVVLDDFDKAPRSLMGFIRTFLPHLDRFTGLKLVAVDLRYSEASTLFAALACYGAALVLVPRLRKRHE